MILNFIPAGTQMLNTKWSCSTDGSVILLPDTEETLDFCFCKFVPDWKEEAFVDVLDDSNTYKNDYKLFLNTLSSDTSTCVYTLISSDGTETVLDANYGEVYEVGFNTSQPLMLGFRVDWVKVVAAFGYGNYSIQTVQTDFGIDYVSTSQTFCIKKYEEERTDGTVKVEVKLDGLIQNGSNYDGVDLYNMFRVNGYFGDKSPQLEKNSTETTSRENVDIQNITYNNYTLSIDLIPKEISNFILDEGLLLGWKITDYNIGNQEDYRDKELSIVSVDNNEIKNTRLTSVTCVLRDVKSNVYRPFI